METEHFLAWLHVADLETTGEENLRTLFEQVLESAPEEASSDLDRFLDELEDQLDADALDYQTILSWPETFSALLPQSLDPMEDLEKELEARADDVTDGQTESPLLKRFRECLDRLRTEPDKEATVMAWKELENLEAEIHQARSEYAAEPFSPEAVSAESVAGHRFLEEGFECWFEAFDLAKVGQVDEALACAMEGNRLFRVVADWSDEVTQAE